MRVPPSLLHLVPLLRRVCFIFSCLSLTQFPAHKYWSTVSIVIGYWYDSKLGLSFTVDLCRYSKLSLVCVHAFPQENIDVSLCLVQIQKSLRIWSFDIVLIGHPRSLFNLLFSRGRAWLILIVYHLSPMSNWRFKDNFLSKAKNVFHSITIKAFKTEELFKWITSTLFNSLTL